VLVVTGPDRVLEVSSTDEDEVMVSDWELELGVGVTTWELLDDVNVES